jgi:hypothetical protein
MSTIHPALEIAGTPWKTVGIKPVLSIRLKTAAYQEVAK